MHCDHDSAPAIRRLMTFAILVAPGALPAQGVTRCASADPSARDRLARCRRHSDRDRWIARADERRFSHCAKDFRATISGQRAISGHLASVAGKSTRRACSPGAGHVRCGQAGARAAHDDRHRVAYDGVHLHQQRHRDRRAWHPRPFPSLRDRGLRRATTTSPARDSAS